LLVALLALNFLLFQAVLDLGPECCLLNCSVSVVSGCWVSLWQDAHVEGGLLGECLVCVSVNGTACDIINSDRFVSLSQSAQLLGHIVLIAGLNDTVSGCSHRILRKIFLLFQTRGAQGLLQVGGSAINRVASSYLARHEQVVVRAEVLHVDAGFGVGHPILTRHTLLIQDVFVIAVFEHFAPLVAQAFLFRLSEVHLVLFIILKFASVLSVVFHVLVRIEPSTIDLSCVKLGDLLSLLHVLRFTLVILLGEALVLCVVPAFLRG